MNRYILKMGGSVITRKKEGRKSVNRKVLLQIAREIREAMDENPFELILVCGVGSFGHPLVVKYNLDAGVYTPLQRKMTKVVNKTTGDLGGIVCKILQTESLFTKQVDASKLFRQKNKKVVKAKIESYSRALKGGKISLSTGVMVPDTALNWSVLSGDRIIGSLAQKINPDAVFLGTDVDGIFTQDPKDNPHAKHIPLVTKKNLHAVIRMAGSSKYVDVTHGMKGKIEKIAEMVHGRPVIIFNLFKKGNLKRVLLGKSIKCTRIQL